MRRLEGISTQPAPRPPPKQDTEFKPCQLKPKRDTKVEPFLEPPIEELPRGAKRSTSVDPKKPKPWIIYEWMGNSTRQRFEIRLWKILIG